MSLGNPWGLLLLTGIPWLLVVHLFQRRPPRTLVSTLFLVQALALRPEAGRRISRLRNSKLLLLQVLMVLLGTWVLVEPQWLRADSSQRVALVLDTSASMSAFVSEAEPALGARLDALEQQAANTQWTIFDSRGRRLGQGDRGTVRAALRIWNPRDPGHDPSSALQVAQNLVRGQGAVLYLTDRQIPLPPGVGLVAIGTPLDNVGFTGARVIGTSTQAIWEATVRNHGRTTAERTLKLGDETRKLQLQPGGLRTIRGTFPLEQQRLELQLDLDRFSLDDRLPLVRPRPKTLRVAVEGPLAQQEWLTRWLQIVGAQVVSEAPDLTLAIAPPGPLPAMVHSGIDFLWPSTAGAAAPRSGAQVALHPWTEGLSLGGLVHRPGAHFRAHPAQQVLVWHDANPLVTLSTNDSISRLRIHFDIRSGNASRMPGFLVLLDRFLEDRRQQLAQTERINVETGQTLVWRRDEPPSMELEGNSEKEAVARAPLTPGFFRVSGGQVVWIEGAARFGDAREADLLGAEVAQVLAATELAPQPQTLADPWRPLWVLLLVAALGLSWFWSARSTQPRAQEQ